jgi:hypothetical protein
MSSQLKTQKDIERNFKPKKNDPYIKEMRIKRFDGFIKFLLDENCFEEFMSYIKNKP